MGYYDGKGYWREDGEGGYDSKGYWRDAGEGGYDSKGYWRESGEGAYDSEGYWREAGEGGYDSKGYWRDGAHSAASDQAADTYGSSGSSYSSGYGSSYSGSSGSYSGSSGASGGSYRASFSDRLMAGFVSLLFKALFVLLAIFLIWTGLRYIGAKLGLLKSTVTVSLESTANGTIDTSEIQIVALARDGKYKETEADYDVNEENVSIKLREGDYEIYLRYDGGLYWIGQLSATGLDDYDTSIGDAILGVRMVILTLYDETGGNLSPDDLAVTDENGEAVYCYQGDDGRYYALYIDASDEVWTIQAEGYEDVQVEFDGNEYRVSDIKVLMSGS